MSHRRGLFVKGHLIRYSAQDAVADGIDCLEHITSVFDFVIPSEVTGDPGHRGRLDLSNPLCESLVAELAQRQTYVDPTLSVFRNMLLLSDVYVPPGFSLHQEFKMLVESGLPPAAVLRAATLTNATVLGEKERLGSIAAGKAADIVLLSANPLDDIRNTRKIERVIHSGIVCSPAEMLKLVPPE